MLLLLLIMIMMMMVIDEARLEAPLLTSLCFKVMGSCPETPFDYEYYDYDYDVSIVLGK